MRVQENLLIRLREVTEEGGRESGTKEKGENTFDWEGRAINGVVDDRTAGGRSTVLMFSFEAIIDSLGLLLGGI